MDRSLSRSRRLFWSLASGSQVPWLLRRRKRGSFAAAVPHKASQQIPVLQGATSAGIAVRADQLFQPFPSLPLTDPTKRGQLR